MLGFSAWQLTDVVLIFALTFGIYKKSRTCAILLLIYFIISKALIIAAAGFSASMLSSLAFFYFYVYGIIGTVEYHQLMKPYKK